MKKTTRLVITGGLGAALCLLTALFGCDGSSPTGAVNDQLYELYGGLVKDVNLHSCKAVVTLQRNDTVVTDADITVGDSALEYENGLFRMNVSPEDLFPIGTYSLEVVDSTFFDGAVPFIIPDTLAVTISDPANRINPGGSQVTLEWTRADSADSYVVATVPQQLAYTGVGYSVSVTGLTTAATIPPDAFRWSTGTDLDTGWYYIYVYAYTDSPDPDRIGDLLPIPWPPGALDDSIDQDRLTGRFGAVLVARRDSVHVVVQ